MEEINEQNWTVATGYKSVIEFYAPGCLNCLFVTPGLDDLVGRLPAVKFYQINLDACPRLAQQLNITATPTVVLFDHGQELARAVGAKPRNYYLDLINQTFI